MIVSVYDVCPTLILAATWGEVLRFTMPVCTSVSKSSFIHFSSEIIPIHGRAFQNTVCVCLIPNRIKQDGCLLYGQLRERIRWIKSCAIIGYPSGQDIALLYGYNSTRALIGCWDSLRVAVPTPRRKTVFRRRSLPPVFPRGVGTATRRLLLRGQDFLVMSGRYENYFWNLSG